MASSPQGGPPWIGRPIPVSAEWDIKIGRDLGSSLSEEGSYSLQKLACTDDDEGDAATPKRLGHSGRHLARRFRSKMAAESGHLVALSTAASTLDTGPSTW